MIEQNLKHRRIRSFVRRESRMGVARRYALKDLWPAYGLSLKKSGTDVQTMFDGARLCILDIGFGMGSSLLGRAAAHPDKHYIGVEVYRPGIARVLQALASQALCNVRLYADDIMDVLKYGIPDNSLEEIDILFPDPWPKRKHHKRRLIQRDFIEQLRPKLIPHGQLRVATDDADYAQHIQSVLKPYHACPSLPQDFTDIVYNTKFSLRAQQESREIYIGAWALNS